MKRTLLALSCLAIAAGTPTAQAADIRHTFAGDATNSFYTDDAGGSVNNGGNNLSYYLNLKDVDQSAIGTLFVYSDDGIAKRVDNGYAEQDFTNGSGIQLFDLTSLPFSSAGGEIGLANDSPLTPVSFLGSDTGLTVEQVTYTSSNPADQFVIVEYRVVNNSTGQVTARIGLSNDFDVDLKSADAKVGFDNSTGIPMVYQQEAPPLDPTNTTVGVGLVRGQLAQYRLETCTGSFGSCQILEDTDAVRVGFFDGVTGQVGDLTGGIPNQDFANTIAATLGSIPPGEGRSAVFCYTLAKGTNPANGLANCKQNAVNCEAFYEDQIAFCGNGLTNFGEKCDDGDSDLSDSCPDGPTGTCQPAICGDGFTWNTDGGTETCDDGNNTTNDSCPSGPSGSCKPATCGDGFIRQGVEGCDDGNTSTTDACPSGPSGSCQLASCGDGFVRQGVEICDTAISGSSCVNNCTRFDSCGNGSIEPGEQCDDGNSNTTDNCPSGNSGTCQTAVCGDGFLHSGVEACDDGNKTNGDGCNSNCQIEGPGGPGGPGGNPSTGTPGPVCGNGIVEAGEQCDDGNLKDNDACSSLCFPLPVLQGGGTSTSGPLEPVAGGCSLGTSKAQGAFPAWMGILALAGLLPLRRKKA